MVVRAGKGVEKPRQLLVETKVCHELLTGLLATHTTRQTEGRVMACFLALPNKGKWRTAILSIEEVVH